MTNYLKFNDKNVSVTIPYADLQRIMKECVTTTMTEYDYARKKREEQKWYNTSQTAKAFSVNVSTINRWKHRGFLSYRTVGGKDYFSVDEINNLLKK